MLTEAQCKPVVEKKGLTSCRDLEYNWLGTDDQGRDVVARLIYGFRISVLFGLALTIISSVIGIAAGAVQGYFGGWVDLGFQRFIEVWSAIPSLYLLLILSSVLVPGFFVLLGILLLFSWVSLVGLVRAEFLRARNFGYVKAARALGVDDANCTIGNWNWLGTDDQARDVLARLIYGFRLSVLFGFTLTIISSLIGVAAGAVQGYFGGYVDLFFQRFIEIWTAIPSLYLLLIISSMLVPTFFVLLGILLLFSWVSLVGLVRAEFLRGRNLEYVQAARALGVSNASIMFRHLLPNAMVATLTYMPFILSSSVATLTSLDFLGFGLPPGSPSLGELLAQGKANIQAPWLGLSGFFTIALMLSLLIFIGEAVRDAFDPRKIFR
jgi:ABC-type microcin C transport system permease subunit YejE